MNRRPFREYHILKLLEGYEPQLRPLDLHIAEYFKSNKALGSKDRAEIAESIYGMIRWQALLDYLCTSDAGWEERYYAYIKLNLEEILSRSDIPDPVKLSFPESLYRLILDSYGEEQGKKLCLECNYPAPTTVRINPMKTTRGEMLKRWNETYEISPCEYAEHGILFHKKISFFSLPEFKEGLFEIQDEGSQLLADLIEAEPGGQVMDYCSGSAGKTLAFAYKMKNKGQIYLHDIRLHILQQAKVRLRRAGIQNAQIIHADDPKLDSLKKKMDWVLVDAPCSGTGTLRRNPDMKWKFNEEMLTRLAGQQRMIFEKALSFVKPEGKIVYGTCSLLKQENEDQIEHFLKTYKLELVEKPFKSLPQRGKMDGFFGAVFKKPL